MRRTSEKRSRKYALLNKKAAAALLALCLAVLLAGCGIQVNVSTNSQDVENLLVNQDLAADPVVYNEDGSYEIVFHYDKGGFEKMDLSQAFVAYYAMTVQDQIDAIVGEDLEEFPPLPEDAQIAFDEAIGTMELRKIARIKIRTLNDNTLSVSFTDRDDPLPGREYFFVIPNMGLAGSVAPG